MLTGVILAGGKNRRMEGVAKALLPFGEGTLIERQIHEMKKVCDEIILVTNEPRSFLPVVGNSIRVVTDFFPGKGPLAGMHAAFSLSNFSPLWVVSCSMPFISAEAAEWMENRKRILDCDAVIPYIEGALQPLHGIYDKRCLDSIVALLNKGETRLMELLKMIRWEDVGDVWFTEQHIDMKFITKMDSLEDYHKALAEIPHAVG